MKRAERHHLKENDLARLARTTRTAVEGRQRQLMFGALAAAVAAALMLGLLTWRGRTQGRADSLLAEALEVEQARVGPPPAPGASAAGLTFPTERDKLQALRDKFKTAADRSPGSRAGVFARYREAATLVSLGELKEAAAAYQLVIDRAGNGLYGQMSRLGLAEAQARSGEFDQAIATFRELSQQKDGPLPVDGILMQLGRTYVEAGKPTEAQQTFNQIVQEHPLSPFSGDAKRELDQLKKT
jgi:TolA-binding protein